MKKLFEKLVPNNVLRDKWFAIGLIVLISTGVYYNSFNVPFLLDDEPKIIMNPDIQKLSNIKTKLIYPYGKYKNLKRNDPSRPVTYLTFTLNYYFGKLNTFGYHLVNLLLHIFNAILIFLLARKIVVLLSLQGDKVTEAISQKKIFLFTRDDAPLQYSNFFALFVALFFAVHPVNTSVVTYIFGRSAGLSTFFYLLSLLFFIEAIEKRKRIVYIFSLLSFILALFSRQDVVTLPIILLLFDFIYLSNFKVSKMIENKFFHIPFWILLIFYFLFRYFYFGGIGDLEAITTLNRFLYLINELYVVLIKYVGLLFIPTEVCLYRGSYVLINSIYDLKVLLSTIILVVISILTWQLYKKKNITSKLLLFSILWYFIVLLPTSSFFPTTGTMVDNRLYLSGLGIYLLIVFLYFSCLQVVTQHLRILVLLILGFHISILSAMTYKKNNLFQNPILLWQDINLKFPSSTSHNILGNTYYIQKEYSKAIDEYQKALVLDSMNAGTHYNLGNTYYGRKEYSKAIDEYQKALEIDPECVEAHNNLGCLYQDIKESDKAIKEYQKVLELNPTHMDALNNLGNAYYGRKEYSKAIDEYQKALEINPNYVKGHIKLAEVYYIQKKYKSALQELKLAQRLEPSNENIKYKIEIFKRLLKL